MEETAPEPFNYKTFHAYDPRGNRLYTVNAKQDTTSFKYDGLDRLVEVKAPMNLVTRHAYDSRSNLIRTTSPDGSVTQYAYNERNQLVKVIDPLQQVTLYDYDGNGNQTAMTDPNGNTTSYTFDDLDRLVEMEDALGNITKYEYDQNSNLTTVTDANGIETGYGFDSLNRQILMTDAIGGETHYEYDFNDNLKKITDANGNPTEYEYDPMNRVTKETFADNTFKTYEYDRAGNVKKRTDNSGNPTDYFYDELNRLTKRDYPGNNDDEFQYDPIGQMTEAKNQYATVKFTHDDAGRLTSEDINGHPTHYQYNTISRKRILTYPSGRIVEEFFDKRSQLSLVKADGVNVANFAYDPAGRMTSKTFGNGTKAVYEHDAANRTTSLKHEKAGVPFVDFAYVFDAVGNKQYERKLHHPTHSEKYGYTELYQLQDFQVGTVATDGSLSNPVTQTEYNYDFLGNRNWVKTDGIEANYLVNEMNEYTEITTGAQTDTLTHDNKGNLTWDGTHNLGYDYESRLISVDGGATATYQQDALGRRIRKEAGGIVTNYYFDGFREIEERDGSDNLTATYVFGSWIDDMLQMKRGGNVYFYHANSLGSVVALSDVAGEVVERYEYEGYGEVQFLDVGFGGMSGSGVGNDVLFTGRFFLSEIKGFNLRIRIYMLNSGRFIQRDPIGYFDGLNLSSYGGNNPIQNIDSYGLSYKNNTCPPITCTPERLKELSKQVETLCGSRRRPGGATACKEGDSPTTIWQKMLRLIGCSLGVKVKVDAGIDWEQNRAYWHFVSLDPSNNQPVTDPFLGFLPVNDTITHRGEGFAHFSLQPRPTTQTFDVLETQASIIFDQNPAIATPVIFNTIDANYPVSQIDTSFSAPDGSHLRVTWSGTDVGCGVANYTIFVSVNDSSFVPWQVLTSATDALLPAELGNQYRFISVARDSVGNVEPAGAPVEVTFTEDLITGLEEPPLSIAGLQIKVYPNPNSGSFSVEIRALEGQHVTLRLIDLMGRVLAIQKFEGRWGDVVLPFKTVGQAAGVYLLEVRSGVQAGMVRVVME